MDKRARWVCVAVVASILASSSLYEATDEPVAADRAKLRQYLVNTRDQVLAETETLTDAQWEFKPAPDRWSVGEVVEHLALTEPFLFDLHQETMALPPADAEKRAATMGKDEMILKLIPDRSQRATAPEPLRPGERLGNRSDVMAAFKERRDRTIEYTAGATGDWRAHVRDSEGPLGPFDAYQWLLFIGAHTERHLGQIREVKAHPDFPTPSTTSSAFAPS